MADVYLAEQTSLGRQVAVKILKSDAIAGGVDVLLKRFELEARAAGGLNHSNLVQIITTGREGDISYIVQEYVPGLNLSQWMKKHGTPDYGTGLKWMQQVAAALRAASEAGVVHRDVKPENIMVTRTGIAKVTDFGLAQLNQPSSPKMNLTQVGTTMGTPWYMSPEQIQGEKIDYRSDQYSLGITCYHMFAGRPPFPGKNAMAVAVQHLKEDPIPLGALRGDLPKELCEIVHRMIQKKPADRFQSAAELETALERLNLVSVNAKLGEPAGLFDRIFRSGDLRRMAIAAAALCAVTFVGGRRLQRPITLPEIPEVDAVVKEETAVRQFAAAMLQPNRAAAWEAVMTHFPGSPEADLAALKLGMTLMSGVVPDEEGAYKIFTNLRNTGELPGKEHLRLLGMIGQAYALQGHARRPTRDRLDKAIADISANVPDETELATILDRAPAELRSFYQRIQLAEQRLDNGYPFNN